MLMGLPGLLLLAGCKSEISDLRQEAPAVETQLTELDRWLLEEFETPYNIRVVYRQMPFRDPVAPGNRSVQLARVKPFLKAYKEL